MPVQPLTKIVATLGPASCSAEVIDRLVVAGVSVFRLNFSHGTLDDHRASIERVREAGGRTDRPIAILGDLQGPRIRTGLAPEGGVPLEAGTRVVIRRGLAPACSAIGGTPASFGTTYDGLVDDVECGHRVLIADGTIRMLAIEKDADSIACTVTQGGMLTSSKGINCPDSALALSTLTDRDRAHVAWAVEHGVDLLALSFVRSADDIRELREVVRAAATSGNRDSVSTGWASRLPIIAKIEVPRAVREIDSILEVVDGIMVARGDLGVEMDFAQVPLVQKDLVAAAHRHGRPCIVATQMLDSMISAATPTRAEATDVAAAILDGADAVMLSGETAVGTYPVLAVEAMSRIAREAEAFFRVRGGTTMSVPEHANRRRSQGAALAHGVAVVAEDLDARGVVVWSQSGNTARYLSRIVRSVPIVAVTSDVSAARRMQLNRGVRPRCFPVPPTFAAFRDIVDAYVQRTALAQVGETVIIVAGEPLGRAGVTNTLAMHVVGSDKR